MNHFHFYLGLEKAVREFRPDVFNIEEEHYSIVTWQAFRIARKYGAIPLFYTWQNIFKKYPPPFSNIEKYVFKNCGAAVTGNSEASAVLRQKGFSGLIREIPQMGVELEQFAPENLAPETRRAAKKNMGLSPDDFWIGFAGRLVEEKGVQDLLHALTLCEANVKAVIIGDGPFAENLKNLAAGLLPADRVKFISQIKSRDIAAYLRAIDTLCLPSHTRPNRSRVYRFIIRRNPKSPWQRGFGFSGRRFTRAGRSNPAPCKKPCIGSVVAKIGYGAS